MPLIILDVHVEQRNRYARDSGGRRGGRLAVEHEWPKQYLVVMVWKRPSTYIEFAHYRVALE